LSKVAETYLRLNAVEVLPYLREQYGYKTLSEKLGVQISVLSRYINGRVLPTTTRAEKILNLFSESTLTEIVKKRLRRTEDGFYDLSDIVNDATLLRLIAKVVSNETRNLQVTKLLTPATDGIPLAVQVAEELRIGLVVAKKRKDTGNKSYFEESVKRSPALAEYLYVPKAAIRRGETVLIVDDVARSGETICSLSRVVARAGARVAGVFTIVMLEEVLERLRSVLGPAATVKSILLVLG
jgi:adenine/guanine phosphoribosyltransferase-like PRPP-binding protein